MLDHFTYTIACDGDLQASGSEVHICHDAPKVLAADGVRVGLVSMPCVDRFAGQDRSYRDALPPQVRARVAVEASSPLALYEHFGFTGERVAERARAVLRPGATP